VINFVNIDPIKALFWCAVINGVVAVPIMVAMMWIVSSDKGGVAITLPYWIKVLGWLAAALMAVTVALLVWSSAGATKALIVGGA
jgi:Mn2+/Fe2+ NRAMP family transporter